jgi:hypothetical protein
MQLPSQHAPLSVLRHDSLPVRAASQNAAGDQVVAGPRQPSAHVENGDIGEAALPPMGLKSASRELSTMEEVSALHWLTP